MLCLQDTTELDLNKRRDDIEDLGVLMSRKVTGLYLHPVLAIDCRDDFVIGLAGFHTFSYEAKRKKRSNIKENRRPIEEKKSHRWLSCAEESKTTLSKAKMITIISDRESDIYEYLARIPDAKTHLIVRSRLQRPVSTEDRSEPEWMSFFIDGLPSVGTRQILVPYKAAEKSISSKIKKHKDREERLATVELRFHKVWVHTPTSRSIKKSKHEAKKICLTVVDVKEVLPEGVELPEGGQPLHWRLLTTHLVESAQLAWMIVEWYKKRWHVEQLFRSAKRGGMRLEDIALSKGECIEKLAFIGLLASVRILQLTLCRSGVIERMARSSFTNNECEVLGRLNERLEGKTQKQKNPYKRLTMAWAYWIVARLGGWKGYTQSEGPAGPVTLKRGLDELASIVSGWELVVGKDVCTT